MSKQTNQAQISIETKILQDISSAKLLFLLSKPLRECLRFCVPVSKEGLKTWLRSCDINFQSQFMKFIAKYPTRIEYSPEGYQNWDAEIVNYHSVNDFDSMFRQLKGIMVKDAYNLQDFDELSVNITEEGLYLSSEEERFQSLIDSVQTFARRSVNPGEKFNDIWKERFHELVKQSCEIDIIDKYNFHPESGPDLNLFFDKLNVHRDDYQRLSKINFFFDSINEGENRRRRAEQFVEENNLESFYEINLVGLPPSDVIHIHERSFNFYFSNDCSYGLVLDMGLPSNLFREEIKRTTTAVLQGLESREQIIKKRGDWIHNYSYN